MDLISTSYCHLALPLRVCKTLSLFKVAIFKTDLQLGGGTGVPHSQENATP